MPYEPYRPTVRDWIAYIVVLPLAAVALPIIAVIAVILKMLGKDKLNVGPDYVIAYVARFVEEEDGDWDWDDFCSVPIRDERLDAVREQVCRFEPPMILTEDDRDELRRLLIEVKAMRA